MTDETNEPRKIPGCKSGKCGQRPPSRPISQLAVSKLWARDIQADNLQVNNITLVGGNAKITMRAEENGVGIWLEHEGASINICAGYDQGVQLSVRCADQNIAHDLSLHGDKTRAAFQVTQDNGEVVSLTADELARLFHQSKRAT